MAMSSHAKEAIAAIKNYARTCTYIGLNDYTRQMGHVLFTAAEVYDWCHPLLTKEDKEEIVALCQGIATQMEIGFPPSGQGAVCGHGGEMQLLRDWLALGIATYDEYPDIYNFVGGRFLVNLYLQEIIGLLLSHIIRAAHMAAAAATSANCGRSGLSTV